MSQDEDAQYHVLQDNEHELLKEVYLEKVSQMIYSLGDTQAIFKESYNKGDYYCCPICDVFMPEHLYLRARTEYTDPMDIMPHEDDCAYKLAKELRQIKI